MSDPPRRRQTLLDGPTLVGESSVVTPAQASKREARLEQIRGPGSPRHFILNRAETVVGRSLQAHVSVESSVISRKHMTLTRSGSQYRCSDLNSANGVFLNGVKAHSALLHEGDTLQIGDVLFVFHEGD